MPRERSRQLIGDVWKYVTAQQSNGGNGGSQAVKTVAIPVTFDQATLYTTGLAVYSPTAGEFLAADQSYFSVDIAWDGTTPLGHLTTELVMPATTAIATVSVDTVDFVQAGGKTPNGGGLVATSFVFDGTAPLRIYIDDGAGSSPGSMHGAGTLVLVIYASPT